jgi:FkbM family methyltransferase|tara:strand:- start:553 stop:1116 length:564 start_codon:yes stop_codon:yes gene_type:complete
MNYPTDKKGNYNLLWSFVKQQKLRTVIDIGAWWGPWTLLWSSRAKTIEAFEPNPDMLSDLKQTTNKLNNCTVYNTALGDTTGKVSMQYETHSGTCHIKDYNGSISLRTLDSYNFQDVDIIKIDVEGFEIPVLNGAKQTIVSQQPWIQIEANHSGKRYGRAKIDIINLLHSWGMKRVKKKWPDHIWRF